MQTWSSDTNAMEKTRRLLDLFVVSVLLDAGAGTRWRYSLIPTGKLRGGSEGLALASLDMFKSGLFSSNPENPCQVDYQGLQRISVQIVAQGLQVSQDNPIEGLEGRTRFLMKLADAMTNAEFFGLDGRPGNMLGEHGECSSGRRIATDADRLSPRTLFITSFVKPSCVRPSPLDRTHGWSRPDLARNAHDAEWDLSG